MGKLSKSWKGDLSYENGFFITFKRDDAKNI